MKRITIKFMSFKLNRCKLSILILSVLTLCLTNLYSQGGQQPAANIDQVRNGTVANFNEPGVWVNGNLGFQQSHYAEGMSIPYRLIMTNMPANTSVDLILGYDVKHSGKNALDYLTSFNRLEPHELTFGAGHLAETIDPLIGVSGLPASPTENKFYLTEVKHIPPAKNSPVTTPVQPGTSFGLVRDAGGAYFSMWNGTITDVDFDIDRNPATDNRADLALDNSTQAIRITFTTGSSGTVLLAWGGHIASRIDWGSTNGVPNSAGGIEGSPYHMRLLDWSLNNLGQQDRSLAAKAVIPQPPCSLDGPDEVCEGTTSTYMGAEVDPAYSPSYIWSIVGDATFKDGMTPTGTTAEVVAGTDDYTVKLMINSPFGSVTCMKMTTVNSAPDLQNASDTFCEDDQSQTTLSDYNDDIGADPADTVVWYSDSDRTMVVTQTGDLAVGEHTFYATVTNSDTCDSDAELTITIDAAPD
ncbi:hypothetical protein E0K83_17635, partial [Gramella sp. BOM4]|nr:hypothetical protein [Christiangramia bathymodioli]